MSLETSELYRSFLQGGDHQFDMDKFHNIVNQHSDNRSGKKWFR